MRKAKSIQEFALGQQCKELKRMPFAGEFAFTTLYDLDLISGRDFDRNDPPFIRITE
jgi:hypothetical protein